MKGGPQPLVSSPPAGFSTLMTSAPRSARICPAQGPASTRASSMTRIPLRGASGMISLHHLVHSMFGYALCPLSKTLHDFLPVDLVQPFMACIGVDFRHDVRESKPAQAVGKLQDRLALCRCRVFRTSDEIEGQGARHR